MPKTTTATPKAAPAAATAAPQEAYPMHYDVRIYPVKTNGALRANASVNINDAFAITNLRVLEGTKGLFVSMPQYQGRNGEYKDICFPCTKESREGFNSAVLDAYQQKLEQMQATAEQQETSVPEQGPVMEM